MAIVHGSADRRRAREKLFSSELNVKSEKRDKRFVERCARHAFIKFRGDPCINDSVNSVDDQQLSYENNG